LRAPLAHGFAAAQQPRNDLFIKARARICASRWLIIITHIYAGLPDHLLEVVMVNSFDSLQ
jgi:hypothetical protein